MVRRSGYVRGCGIGPTIDLLVDGSWQHDSESDDAGTQRHQRTAALQETAMFLNQQHGRVVRGGGGSRVKFR